MNSEGHMMEARSAEASEEARSPADEALKRKYETDSDWKETITREAVSMVHCE